MIMDPERDITPKNRGQKIPVQTLQKLVRIILIDKRKGNLVKRVEMMGMMNIPITVYLGEIRTNWHFDELKNPVKGLALDVQANGCNLVFPFLEREDALDIREERSLSLEELKQIFLKYHPTMKISFEG